MMTFFFVGGADEYTGCFNYFLKKLRAISKKNLPKGRQQGNLNHGHCLAPQNMGPRTCEESNSAKISQNGPSNLVPTKMTHL